MSFHSPITAASPLATAGPALAEALANGLTDIVTAQEAPQSRYSDEEIIAWLEQRGVEGPYPADFLQEIGRDMEGLKFLDTVREVVKSPAKGRRLASAYRELGFAEMADAVEGLIAENADAALDDQEPRQGEEPAADMPTISAASRAEVMPSSSDDHITAAFERVRAHRAYDYSFDDVPDAEYPAAEIEAADVDRKADEELIRTAPASSIEHVICRLKLLVPALDSDRWVDRTLMTDGFDALLERVDDLDYHVRPLVRAIDDLQRLTSPSPDGQHMRWLREYEAARAFLDDTSNPEGTLAYEAAASSLTRLERWSYAMPATDRDDVIAKLFIGARMAADGAILAQADADALVSEATRILGFAAPPPSNDVGVSAVDAPSSPAATYTDGIAAVAAEPAAPPSVSSRMAALIAQRKATRAVFEAYLVDVVAPMEGAQYTAIAAAREAGATDDAYRARRAQIDADPNVISIEARQNELSDEDSAAIVAVIVEPARNLADLAAKIRFISSDAWWEHPDVPDALLADAERLAGVRA